MPLSVSLLLLAALAVALVASVRRALHRAHVAVVAAAWRAQDPQRWELLDEPAPLYRSRLEVVSQGEQGPALFVGAR